MVNLSSKDIQVIDVRFKDEFARVAKTDGIKAPSFADLHKKLEESGAALITSTQLIKNFNTEAFGPGFSMRKALIPVFRAVCAVGPGLFSSSYHVAWDRKDEEMPQKVRDLVDSHPVVSQYIELR